MSVEEQKKQLRREMFAKRNQVEAKFKQEYDQWVCQELEKRICTSGSKVVHSYIPFLTEIDLHPLLETLLQSGITVVCPKTLPKRMLENRMLSALDDLEVGIMGTKHPATPEVYTGHYDLIIVPGLAFDARRYRLGYGGGYYDHFLATQPDALKIGIFYPFQQVDRVPTEPHDIGLDELLVQGF